jgi:hypothetical protein
MLKPWRKSPAWRVRRFKTGASFYVCIAKNPEQVLGADCVQNLSVTIFASFCIILNQLGSKQIPNESGFAPFFTIISYEMLLFEVPF